ncbi:VWA domain-containing protein [Nocardia sp. NPDC005825]|uniref:vWA domain-containing protein n=1 Tax=unclassified Nocardia TaxID=2637762 RepID=UPI0033E74110
MRSESRFGVTQAGVSARRVFPFYIVCDVSRSMWDPDFNPGQPITPLDTIEQSLPDMLGVLADDPTTYDTAHLSVIAFGDSPVPVLPLTPLRSDPALPRLPRQGSTDYAQVFSFLNRMLRDDQQRFARAGLQSYTPVVFFLTDGNPQVNGQLQRDEVWLPVRHALEAPGHPFRPVVVALGIGEVTEGTVRQLRSIDPVGAACVATGGVAPGDLLRAIINSIKFSISSSVGQGAFLFRTPAGMRRLE